MILEPFNALDDDFFPQFYRMAQCIKARTGP